MGRRSNWRMQGLPDTMGEVKERVVPSAPEVVEEMLGERSLGRVRGWCQGQSLC